MTHKPIRCACGRKFAQVEHWEAHRQSFHKGKPVAFTTKPRGDDWADIYPEPVRKLILADRRRKAEAEVDKVIAFPVKSDVPPDGAA